MYSIELSRKSWSLQPRTDRLRCAEDSEDPHAQQSCRFLFLQEDFRPRISRISRIKESFQRKLALLLPPEIRVSVLHKPRV